MGESTLIIHPEASSLQGKSYAVYVSGLVHVNSTIQEPVWAHSDHFSVKILDEDNKWNTAPDLMDAQETILVYPIGSLREQDSGEQIDDIYTVGMPIDRQLDHFYVSKWGIKGLSKKSNKFPHWI